MNNQELSRAIFGEISNPTLGVTEQFFTVHKLKADNPVALIESHTDSLSEAERPWWRVYLNENRYYYYHSTPKEWDFGDKFKVLIEVLSGRSQELKAVSKESVFCQVNVAYYGWQSQMWGCHFDAEDIAALASMGVSVDIDLYAEGPELPYIPDEE